MTKLDRLFQPITIGRVELKNRVVMTAMAIGYVHEGHVTQRLTDFLVERARGGVGLIMTSVTTNWGMEDLCPQAFDDSSIAGLRELVKAVHDQGAKIGAQFLFSGHHRRSKDAPVEIIGASEVAIRPKAPPRRAFTKEEIHGMVERFGEGARRAREAGFDLIEISAGVGNLVHTFMSPAANKRQDEYGGGFENRIRFLSEIIDSMKRGAGEDFTYMCRFSFDELTEGGYDLEGGKEIAAFLERAGMNCLDCYVGWHDSPRPIAQHYIPPGHWAYLAQGIKSAVSLPVVAAYRMDDPLLAERILAEGKADLIGMARALIADPEFVNKAREGRFNEIRRCICCCRCMDAALSRHEPLDICSVNPRIGEGMEISASPVPKPKKVMVVGGGPAGMEAALVSAVRGHEVTIYDKARRLGGSMLLGQVLNREVEKVITYLTDQVRDLPVKVELGKEVTATFIEGARPDAVVLAIGGLPAKLEVPGANGDNVLSPDDVKGLMIGHISKKGGVLARVLWFLASVSARYFYSPRLMRWALGFGFPFKKKVAVIGGEYAGCELAETLAEKGKQVIILEESKRINCGYGPSTRFVVRERLRELGVRMETNARVVEIAKEGVRVSRDDSTELFEAETVVPVISLVPNNDLAKQLQGKVPSVYSIGDCVDPQKIGEAIRAGFRAGSEV